MNYFKNGFYMEKLIVYNVVNNKKEKPMIKTLFYTASLKFKPSVSIKQQKLILKSLEQATEHKWKKVNPTLYTSEAFDFASHMKPSIVYLIIKETRTSLEKFNMSIYFIKEYVNKIVKFEDEKLTFIK